MLFEKNRPLYDLIEFYRNKVLITQDFLLLKLFYMVIITPKTF